MNSEASTPSRQAPAGFVDGLTLAAGMAELVRETLRSLREEEPTGPPRALTLAIGASEAAAAASAAALARTTIAVEAAVSRLPGPLRARAQARLDSAASGRAFLAERGGAILASGRDEAAKVVSNGVDAILPYIAEQLVPRLLDSLRPYLANEVVPSLVDDLLPYLTEELVPKVIVDLMPTLRSDILPVVIGDLASSDELRDLIREQSQGFVRETTDEVKVRTRHADDALEDRVRRLLRLRLRDAAGGVAEAIAAATADDEADHGAPVP